MKTIQRYIAMFEHLENAPPGACQRPATLVGSLQKLVFARNVCSSSWEDVTSPNVGVCRPN